MSLAFVVVESTSVVVESPFALQYSQGHSSFTFELVRLFVGSSFATLEGSTP